MLASVALILLGLLLLLFGRNIFWLFVGAAGFILGISLARTLLGAQAEWAQLLAALFVGMIFAGLAIALQKPMAMVGGFLALGNVGLALGTQFGAPNWLSWMLFIALGLVGLLLVALLFDWALIIASAANGASAIVSGLAGLVALPAWLALLALLVLAIGGIWFQSRDLVRAAPAPRMANS